MYKLCQADAVVAQGQGRTVVKAIVVGSIPTRDNIFNIFFFSLWSQDKARNANTEFGGKWGTGAESFNTRFLGSLCLSCCVRDTA